MIQEQTERKQQPLANLLKSIQSKIIGQHHLIESMLVCLLADGHILIEGMPGLASPFSPPLPHMRFLNPLMEKCKVIC